MHLFTGSQAEEMKDLSLHFPVQLCIKKTRSVRFLLSSRGTTHMRESPLASKHVQGALMLR